MAEADDDAVVFARSPGEARGFSDDRAGSRRCLRLPGKNLLLPSGIDDFLQ